jgi:hypothetical protein
VKERLADPKVASNASLLSSLFHELETAGSEVEQLYQRWQELQAIVEKLKSS